MKTPQTIHKVLTAREVEILLRSAKSTNHRFYYTWVFALQTGMRSGELSQGVPLVKVMAIVGHKKMETTDIYLRLAGVDIKGATEALDASSDLKYLIYKDFFYF